MQVALDPAQLGGLGVQRAAARAGQHVDALGQLLLAHRDAARATRSSSARAGRARRPCPNSGQNSQKPNPVSGPDEGEDRRRRRTTARRGSTAPATAAARRWPFGSRTARATGIDEPEPDPDRPEIMPKPVAAQITTITKTMQPGHAELHRVHDAPVDLAPGLVHHSSFSMTSTIALDAAVSSLGRDGVRYWGCPHPATIARRCLPPPPPRHQGNPRRAAPRRGADLDRRRLQRQPRARAAGRRSSSPPTAATRSSSPAASTPTTNNRMELTAALEGLRSLPDGADVDRGHRLAADAQLDDGLAARLEEEGLEDRGGQAGQEPGPADGAGGRGQPARAACAGTGCAGTRPAPRTRTRRSTTAPTSSRSPRRPRQAA